MLTMKAECRLHNATGAAPRPQLRRRTRCSFPNSALTTPSNVETSEVGKSRSRKLKVEEPASDDKAMRARSTPTHKRACKETKKQKLIRYNIQNESSPERLVEIIKANLPSFTGRLTAASWLALGRVCRRYPKGEVRALLKKEWHTLDALACHTCTLNSQFHSRDLSSIFLGLAYIGNKVWLLSVLSALAPAMLEKLLPVRESQFLPSFQDSQGKFVEVKEENDGSRALELDAALPLRLECNNYRDAPGSPSVAISAASVDTAVQNCTRNSSKRRMRERAEYLRNARESWTLEQMAATNGDMFSVSEAVALFWCFGQLRCQPRGRLSTALQLHLAAVMPELNPSQLASLYWSLARLNIVPVTELQWCMEYHIKEVGKQIKPRHLMKMITAAHQAKCFECEMQKAIDYAMANTVKELTTQQLLTLVGSYAKIRTAPLVGLAQLQKRVCRVANGFDSTQCVAVVKSFAEMGVVPDKKVLFYLQERLLALGTRLTPRESLDLLHSYKSFINLLQGSISKQGSSECGIWSSIEAIAEAGLLDSGGGAMSSDGQAEVAHTYATLLQMESATKRWDH